jgi:tetratricopeptide (TPR) repeat protein
LEAATLRSIPNHLKAVVQIYLAAATSDMNAIKLAKKLALSPNDYPNLKLDRSYCMLYGGYVLVDTGKYDEALEELITAEEEIPESLTRRKNCIQTLQAECFLATKQYDDAELVAEAALERAQSINSKPNIMRLRRVTNTLKKRTSQ